MMWLYFGQNAPSLINKVGSKVQRSKVHRSAASLNYTYKFNFYEFIKIDE